MRTLVLLRHGQSEGNARSVFTGWIDVPLTDDGRAEAVRSGELLGEAGIKPDVVHTSVLRRAIGTAALTLDACDRHWIPTRRSWRLNERHYGSLQGRSKSEILTEFGEEQYDAWRRSRDAAPPPSSDAEFLRLANDPRYAAVAPELIPRTESHAQVAARLLPYWFSSIAPDLLAGRVTCVVAHGNSLRALVKHLDRTSDEASAGRDIPTGIPLVYDLDDSLRPTAPNGTYLDAERAAIAIAAIAREGRPSG
ncbi:MULTISPECIES: 2,3-bisphosphoglycerate-dependent phosphoglycerate mutase [unclassified Mycobacterium]|uniref:2,3-bisphosphoglycerate-dependent phosphoglycerate mutase n=1 Tax=unclassified Mycobacterium TaxID=2642494 RepID=UPI0029C83FD0|nr:MULTISPECIES: 2,3-bisphosphoglycerate-dependent phosphoglycerate mutase [unclassified Mycobacterium]